MTLQKHYMSTAGLALFSKGFNLLSTFGVLWLQSTMMDKDSFGLFMMAFSLMFTLSMVLSAGFQALILYHVSRTAQDNPDTITALSSQIFWLSGILSLVCGGLIYGFSPHIARLMGHTALLPWLQNMALFIPVNTAALVLPSYSRARQRVKETLFFQEIFLNGLRVLLVGLLWLLALPPLWTAHAYILSTLIPVMVLFFRAPLWPNVAYSTLTRWDLTYALKSTAFQVLNQPFRGLDIVLVGFFTTASIAADYAMAVRLSQMLWIPKHAVAQLQVPRMGALLAKHDMAQLTLEYNAMRAVSLVAVLGACAGLLFFGGPLLSLFGDYHSALPALYILAAASVIRTGFGASGDLLGMAGHAGDSALIAGFSMVITCVGTAWLVPNQGAEGAAFVIFISTLQLFTGFVRVLKRKEGLHLLPPFMCLVNILASLALLLPAGHFVPLMPSGLILLALAGIVPVVDKSWTRLISHAS